MFLFSLSRSISLEDYVLEFEEAHLVLCLLVERLMVKHLREDACARFIERLCQLEFWHGALFVGPQIQLKQHELCLFVFLEDALEVVQVVAVLQSGHVVKVRGRYLLFGLNHLN